MTTQTSETNSEIPVHFLPGLAGEIPDLRIFRFKNTPEMPGSLPIMQLPITPLPTDLPHRHSYCEILFFESGSGFHEIDMHTHMIRSPGIHFVAPGKVHLLTPTDECVGYIITFPQDYSLFYSLENDVRPGFTSLWGRTSLYPLIDLSEESHTYFKNLLENMLSDYLETGSERQTLLASYLHIFLKKCEQLAVVVEPRDARPAGDIHARFQEMVEVHYLEKHRVQDYAALLSVTTDYLGKSVKKAMGISASDYILDRLLLEAKRLIVFTGLTSKEIAYKLHIEDPSYFSRMFKRKTGLSPSEYRFSMRKSAKN